MSIRTRRSSAIGRTLALAALAALLLGLLLGSAAHGASPPGRYINRAAGIESRLPFGWHAFARSITATSHPRQVLAAASYPAPAPRSPRGCTPRSVLAKMPPKGALIRIVEYTPRSPAGKRVKVPKFPPMPRAFRYSDRKWNRHECAGPSYRFVFKLDGRAFQAHIWMHRRTVNLGVRSAALQILNSFTIIAKR